MARIRIRRPRIRGPRIPNPSRWINGISGSSLSDIKNSVSTTLKSVEDEFNDLPDDIKREVSNIGDVVEHWTEQQLQVYKQTYNKLVQVVVELSANLGADEAAKEIIAKTVTLYQQSSGTDVDDCSLIVKAIVTFYAYSVKETKPDLAIALLTTAVTDAIPAACRLALN